jgi:hypothetical protein
MQYCDSYSFRIGQLVYIDMKIQLNNKVSHQGFFDKGELVVGY